jgi:ABC-type antimicrobial peptide transport system permease subunit
MPRVSLWSFFPGSLLGETPWTETGAALILGSQLYGVSGIDPVALVGVTILLLAVGLTAGYFPARHATRVDPIQALRHE